MSLLDPDTFTGRTVRLPLRLVGPSRQVRILAPRQLFGTKWIIGAGLHACWLGTYEMSKRQSFVDATRPGMVVLDVGAQAGYYTLLSSQLVGATGTVFAIEPVPRNLDFLRTHLEINRRRNVTVLAAAAAESDGNGTFQTEQTSYMGRLSPSGGLQVRTVALDSIATKHGVRPDIVKIDVEGGEAEVLRGASHILAEHRPLVFLATHGPVPHEQSCAVLRDHGYQLEPLDAPTVAAAREILARPGRPGR
jgi:FkbM family methyltransferase